MLKSITKEPFPQEEPLIDPQYFIHYLLPYSRRNTPGDVRSSSPCAATSGLPLFMAYPLSSARCAFTNASASAAISGGRRYAAMFLAVLSAI